MRYTAATEVRDAGDPGAIARAAQVLRRGGLVAFPTETVYGLGAHALDADAVARIYSAKGRPAHNPLIVHLAGAELLPRLAREVPGRAHALAAAFWPGPLTLVLPRQPEVPAIVTAGGPTVAVRVPAHPVARELLRAAGLPVVAPSANRFTRPSPTTAQHVLADLRGHVDLVLDGGPTPIGVESTVIDLTRTPPVLLRPGGVTLEALRAHVPDLADGTAAALPTDRAAGAPAASPGMLARHYAPAAEVLLYAGPVRERVLAAMAAAARERRAAGQRVAVLVHGQDAGWFAGEDVEVVPLGDDLDAVARELFATLRSLDARQVDVVIVRQFAAAGLGRTLADRLRRAADGREILVP
jgi:L-threonylcarbamoyladenylate synthase